MKNNYSNPNHHHHQNSANLYYDSPLSSQREQDIAALIEKKLGSIESYFQSFENRIAKIESLITENRNANFSKNESQEHQHGLKLFREEFYSNKTDCNKRLATVEQRISDLSRSLEKTTTSDKFEKSLKEQHLAIENLQEKMLKIQENLSRDHKSYQKISSEILESVKQSLGSDLRALSNMIQNIQENQIHLEEEINSMKKIKYSNIVSIEKENGRTQYPKHSAQSPVKKKFEHEPTETSEEERPSINKHHKGMYPQASPYSPNRLRSNLSSHEDLSEATKNQGKRDFSNKKETNSKYEQSPYGALSRKKYEMLIEDNTTPSRKESKPDPYSDGSKNESRNKVRGYDEEFNNERTNTLHDELLNKPYNDLRNLTDPSKETLTFKKNDRKESSLSSTWLDNDRQREHFELKYAAIQKNKEKIKEDIENLKKLVKREKEKRSTVTAERIRGIGRSPERAEDKSLTKLQSATSVRNDPAYSEHSTPNKGPEIYRKEAPRTSSGIPQNEHNEYATFRYDDIGKEKGDSHLRVASILEEKSRTRSTSLYDARQQVGQLAQERKDGRLPEDKKKQIDQEIERRIREETEKRKRENIVRGSGSQYSDHEKLQSNDEKGYRDRLDPKKSHSFKK